MATNAVKDASGHNRADVQAGNATNEDLQLRTTESSYTDNITEKEGTIITSNSSLTEDGAEDSSDGNSSLLPTPVMPYNWLDPSRKPDSGNESESIASGTYDNYGKYSSLQTNNDIMEMGKNENEESPIIPEKICSPLLPTPVMPQNWLDPCKRSEDLSSGQSSQSLQTVENDNANPPPVTSYESETNVILDANYLSTTSCPTFMDSSYLPVPLFFNESSQEGYNNQPILDPPGQSYAQYSEQPIQERNFQPKISPPWNKQARQTQPYYRPQAQSSYGVNSYSSQVNDRYYTPATMSTSSGYSYNPQVTDERKENYQWNL